MIEPPAALVVRDDEEGDAGLLLPDSHPRSHRDLRVGERQRLLARVSEEALATAEHDGEDHEAKLVDEIQRDQALHELRAAGVGVPGQMSVVSFDEDECLAFLEVPVTSVAMPLAELGGAAVDQLIARIERHPAGDVMIREPMKLLTRRSVARP